MIRYRLDGGVLKRLIARNGYANVAQFAIRNRINRATLNNYLKGKGPLSESFYDLCQALKADPLTLLVPASSLPQVQYLDEIMPLVKAVTAHDEQVAIGLLGSRVKGTMRRYSDWDLGITHGAGRLTGEIFLGLKRIVDDLADDLPRNVDLMNLDQAPGWFLKGIDYDPIFLAGNETSWNYFLGVLHGARKAA